MHLKGCHLIYIFIWANSYIVHNAYSCDQSPTPHLVVLYKICSNSMLQAMKETFATSWRSAELPKVNEFLSKTVHLLLEMLMSESPVIPWNELKRIEPKLVDVIPSQHHSQQATFDDEVSYHAPKFYCKRPILLSCSHAQVKIYQGRIVEVKERKR